MKITVGQERRPVIFELEDNEYGKGYFHGFFQSKQVVDALEDSKPKAVVETIEGEVITVNIENMFFVDQQNWYNDLLERNENGHKTAMPTPTPEEAFDIKHGIKK